MPDPESREQLFQDYFELQQEAQSYATQVRTRDKHISYLLKSLKQVATPREADVHTNVAQVVLNTRAINRIIKEIQSNIDKKPSLTSIAQQQTLGAPFNFEESSKIIEEGEKLTEREDLNTQAANYLLTMTEAQVIGGELETLATETQNMKPSDRSVLTDVQNGTTTMEERVKSMLGRLADRAKMVGESFLKIINGIK